MTRAHFNDLTPEELEALSLIAEECGEVIHVIGKILRHGLLCAHPDGGPDNQRLLTVELGDLRAAVVIAQRIGMLNENAICAAGADKLSRVGKYLHHIQPLIAKVTP